MRCRLFAFSALLPFTALIAGTPAFAQATLSPAETNAAFLAAGYKKQGGQWKKCGDPGTTSYSPGAVEQVRDLNGDKLPEAVLTEGGTYCFGMTGTGFDLVSKQPDGKWKVIYSSQGIARFLGTKGIGGWPDVEIGGPGFCFPILRWDGKTYRHSRNEYEGKPCKR